MVPVASAQLRNLHLLVTVGTSLANVRLYIRVTPARLRNAHLPIAVGSSLANTRLYVPVTPARLRNAHLFVAVWSSLTNIRRITVSPKGHFRLWDIRLIVGVRTAFDLGNLTLDVAIANTGLRYIALSIAIRSTEGIITDAELSDARNSIRCIKAEMSMLQSILVYFMYLNTHLVSMRTQKLPTECACCLVTINGS